MTDENKIETIPAPSTLTEEARSFVCACCGEGVSLRCLVDEDGAARIASGDALMFWCRGLAEDALALVVYCGAKCANESHAKIQAAQEEAEPKRGGDELLGSE